ncbi:MAG: hypothetical protein GXX12_06050 [Methanosarcina thermophila]|nr:hypothetical protein [Methanosarcina thermophila]
MHDVKILQSECLRAINTKVRSPRRILAWDKPKKDSLVYNLQEPFRFLVDLTVISLVENGAVK